MRQNAPPEPGTIRTCDAAAAAGITGRQLDYWLTNQAIPHDDPNPGSGRRRYIPDWYIPRLRLMGQINAAFGHQHNGGLNCATLRRIFDAYETGYLNFDDFMIVWDVKK